MVAEEAGGGRGYLGREDAQTELPSQIRSIQTRYWLAAIKGEMVESSNDEDISYLWPCELPC